MRIRLFLKVRYLLLIIIFGVICSSRASAQAITFVHITDPHLFDGGKEETENKAALAACIKKINEHVDGQAGYKFAVITGDIGIENLVSEIIDDNRVEFDEAKKERLLEQGAAQLASILSASKIRTWLFLPGNNDLFNELPDTQYYRAFIHKLQSKLPGLEVIDLCPEEPESDKLELGVYRLGEIAFIGFNNSSFKNENEYKRIATNEDKQLKYVRQVARRIGPQDIRIAYVFYHIPELDDPHIVLNSDTKILAKRQEYKNNPYPYSSWFVASSVHDEWKKVVGNPRIRGLFAGHYHDWRRDTYISHHWLQTGDYLSGSLSKLYISPPLAIKRQDNTPSQARGFQEVTIDGAGRVGTKILWLNAVEQTFDTAPSSHSNQLQLALFYEGAQQWSEAETNFKEVAKNAPSAAVRDSALAGLKRVEEAQHAGLKNTLLNWTAPSTLGPLLLRGLIVIGVPLVIYLFFLALKEGSRAMVIYPFEGDEVLAKHLAVGFSAVRAGVINILGTATVNLPETVSTVYPFVSPNLNDLFPQGSFEVAGMKVPDLSIILKWLVRPRFRVTGGVLALSSNKYVYAEVWRRQGWFGSRPPTVVIREIPGGEANTIELENFIFDVYLKAYGTLRTQ